LLQWAAAVAWCGSGCRDVGSMRSSTVSAPVQSCSATLTPSSKKYAAVELLTRQTLYFIVEVNHCSSSTPPGLSLVKEPECESTRFPLISIKLWDQLTLPTQQVLGTRPKLPCPDREYVLSPPNSAEINL